MENLRIDKKNRWFASRGWYASALALVIWAILQEIIMSSTDLVDNFFANTMKRNVDGATELKLFLEQTIFIKMPKFDNNEDYHLMLRDIMLQLDN